MAGSILQTNVKQFAEQPGRQIVRTQGGLDKMTVKLLGPWWKADQYRPGRGSPHPDYPMMFALTSTTAIVAGGLAEITVQYAGRTDTQGTANFKSEILETSSISEGEVSYSTYFTYVSQVILSGSPSSPGQLAIWAAGLSNFSIRYGALNNGSKYVTNYPPSGPSAGGASVLWSYIRAMGTGSIQYVTRDGFTGPSAESLGLTPTHLVTSVRPTGWSSQQIIGPWYENNETWSFRYETAAG